MITSGYHLYCLTVCIVFLTLINDEHTITNIHGTPVWVVAVHGTSGFNSFILGRPLSKRGTPPCMVPTLCYMLT